MAPSLPQLIDDITVDAHNTDEQLSGFLQMFQDEVTVEVIGFDQEGDERRGLVARCRHQGTTDALSLADVHFEPVGRRVASRGLPDLALRPTIPCPPAARLDLASLSRENGPRWGHPGSRPAHPPRTRLPA